MFRMDLCACMQTRTHVLVHTYQQTFLSTHASRPCVLQYASAFLHLCTRQRKRASERQREEARVRERWEERDRRESEWERER